MRRPLDRLKYLLERLIQRGSLFQLLLMAAVIALVAFGGGLLAWTLTDAFPNAGVAVWWAFLRLTDPGYLGDDAGATLRTLATAITVLGYVLFMGSLVAILTQGLNQTMRTLERGLTPISLRGHLLVLGWTNRTPAIIRELLQAEGRVQRFLALRGTRRLRIVVLADDVDPALRVELREQLGRGRGWDRVDRQVIFRSGSSMRIEHLRRVAFADAAAILVPAADFALGGAGASDARVIKTLMSIAKYGRLEERPDPPSIVAEVLDAQKEPIAEGAYPGALNLIASDAFVSRLIAQTVRHRGLSFVYAELLSHALGNEVYVRTAERLAGTPIGRLRGAFPEAILLGLVRPRGRGFAPHLNPPPDLTLEADDRLVLVARSYEDTAPPTALPAAAEASAPPSEPLDLTDGRRRRILVLGWSHKVPTLLRTFGNYTGEAFEIDVASVTPPEERDEQLARLSLPADRLTTRQIDADYTVLSDLRALDPGRYSNVLLLGSDWLASSEASDARTVLGYVLLRSLLPEEGPRPEIVVELIDPANARLFPRRMGEVIVSPVIVSHLLAHVALRPELDAVFDEVFGPGGAEIAFRSAATFGLDGQTATFAQVQARAHGYGETALGVRLAGKAESIDGGVRLNPPKGQAWPLTADDAVIVLATGR